jgi:hypothetical protein
MPFLCARAAASGKKSFACENLGPVRFPQACRDANRTRAHRAPSIDRRIMTVQKPLRHAAFCAVAKTRCRSEVFTHAKRLRDEFADASIEQ